MSEFWKRKMRTYIYTFDLDKDGIISKADWVGIPISFANFTKADKQKAERTKTEFENIFEQFMKAADPADKNVLTVEVLTDAVGKLRYNPELMKNYTGIAHCALAVMDLNKDGFLQGHEYEKYIANLGVEDPSFAREAFRKMDVNHKGELSFDEFLTAFWDFFFSDDESPNAYFFGPLLD